MKKNQLIVDSRETGKTTYLFNEIHRLVKEGNNIIILDSATEHQDKSLLKKVINYYNNAIIIDVKEEKSVALREVTVQDFIKNFTNYFPFNEILSNKDKIICFDLSHFLEKGHAILDETKNIEKYNYYRNLYNLISQQIALSLILMEKLSIIRNSIVVMDEIEFPIVDYDISIFQKNIDFIAAVHPENAFGTFYQSFDKIKFKTYQKRKD